MWNFSPEELRDWYGFKVLRTNIPKKKCGGYLFVNLLNDKCYVGISNTGDGVHSRGRSHGNKSPNKFRNALIKHGKENFLFLPLFYATEGMSREDICRIETDLIVDYDSIDDGYNVLASGGGAGPYGEAFSEIMKEAIARPEVRKRRIDGLNRPEVQARINAGKRAAWADPEVRAKYIAALDEARERQREGILRAFADPEIRERMIKISRENIKIARETAFTEDAKAKHRISCKNMWTPERHAKHAAYMRAKWANEEFKEKMSTRLKERQADPDVKLRQRAGTQAAWDKRRGKSQPEGCSGESN